LIPCRLLYMKSWLRQIALFSLSLYITSFVFAGVKISGGFWTFAISGLALSILSLILKPILTILTFPFHFLSFGYFSFVINAVILYVLTILVPEVSIHSFTFQGAKIAGFIIPTFYLNTFFAYIVSSAGLSFFYEAINWSMKE